MGLLIRQIVEGGPQRQKLRSRKRVRISEGDTTRDTTTSVQETNQNSPQTSLRRRNARIWNQSEIPFHNSNNTTSAHDYSTTSVSNNDNTSDGVHDEHLFRENLQTLEREADSIRRNLGDNIRLTFLSPYNDVRTNQENGNDRDNNDDDETNYDSQSLGYDARRRQRRTTISILRRRPSPRTRLRLAPSSELDVDNEDDANPNNNTVQMTSWTRRVRRRTQMLNQADVNPEREALFHDLSDLAEENETQFRVRTDETSSNTYSTQVGESFERNEDQSESVNEIIYNENSDTPSRAISEDTQDNRNRNRYSFVMGNENSSTIELWTVEGNHEHEARREI